MLESTVETRDVTLKIETRNFGNKKYIMVHLGKEIKFTFVFFHEVRTLRNKN